MRYRLTVVPIRFLEGSEPAMREFLVDTDAQAIFHAELPPVPLKFIAPDGEAVGSTPRKLEELNSLHEVIRIVKEWW